MRPGLWRNKKCFDIDFRVIRTTYSGPTYLKVKLMYFYRKEYKGKSLAGKPVTYQVDTVKIKRSDFSNWSFLEI